MYNGLHLINIPHVLSLHVLSGLQVGAEGRG